MAVTVMFDCDGCDSEIESTIINREFHGLNGRDYGFGSYYVPPIADAAPPGWIAFDPYTGCCYCPECWLHLCEPVGGPAAVDGVE